ncbi:MAG: [Fe-Fe] hydrogenase large subunit C-terminal domain-containing protein, partial [Thermodesulfobacteriota bacterium]
MATDHPEHLPVIIDREKCDGCLACLKVCPTKAMRVRDKEARIRAELCIYCGECIQACPRQAVRSRGPAAQAQTGYKIRALLPSPVLYTQFGDRISPNDVLVALTRLGYDYVFDQAVFCEWVSLAVNEWVAGGKSPLPAISATCPVVVRLIRLRYRELMPHLVRVSPPREVGARYIRRLLSGKLGLAGKEIGLFHVTPCTAKGLAINAPDRTGGSSLDAALGLDEIYGPVLRQIKQLTAEDRETMLFRGGGFGIGWEMSGGETAGLRHVENTLSVCGLKETIEALELIEFGRLGSVQYVECRV